MNGKPWPVGFLALMCVAAADDYTWMLKQWRKTRGLGRRIPRGDEVDAWLKLYRRHNRVWDAAMRLIGFGEKEGELTGTQMARECRRMTRLKQTDPEAFKAELKAEIEEMGIDEFNKMVRELQEIMPGKRDLIDLAKTGPEISEEDAAEFDAKMPGLELQFFMGVCGPCWMEYGIFPSELMLEARRGDIDALDKLLRLDKLAMFDPVIRDHIIAAAYDTGRGGRHARISKAIKGKPAGSMTEKRIKCALAGFIHLVSQELDSPLGEPEIRGLFDAVAKMRGKLRDDDLPASSETFYKAIQRQRKVRRFGARQRMATADKS